MSIPLKLAIVTSHPIQYQVPLFRVIAQQLDIDLTVYFGCDYGINPTRVHPGFDKAFSWDIPMLDGYKHVFLKNSKLDIEVNDWRLDGPELKPYFKSERYDAVLVFGWNKMVFWQAIWWARKYGIPLILRAESNLKQAQSWYIKVVKEILFPFLFKQFKSFMSIGSFNTELYLHFGVPEEAIFLAPYSVDNSFFSKQSKEKLLRSQHIRKELGIKNDDTVFIYSAKLIERKRPLDLIAASILNKAFSYSHVIFVGDGPLLEKCQNEVAKSGLANIHFVGFKNQSVLPEYYAAADVMVLPSEYETWGLVLNEAMACGLPCIATDACGAAVDIIIEGKTGYTYPVGDVKRLSEIMKFMIKNTESCSEMGRNAAEYIQKCSIDSTMSALADALHYIGSE